MGKDEIKQIRKKTGLNAEKFGALIGVGKKTVESWEQGVRNPSGPARKILERCKYDNKKRESMVLSGDRE